VRPLDERLGWSAEAASLIDDSRHPDRTQITVLEMLRQRFIGLVSGYEDQNDHDRMRTDPVLKLACDHGPKDDPRVLALNEREKAILDLVGPNPQHIDELVTAAKFAPSIVSSTLMTLEIRGLIRQLACQRYVSAT
jgi:predicted Rossmann fold nucleotide-binding protein DprA/Smf involved in DNA uptake